MILKHLMIDTPSYRRISKRYDVSFNQLAVIIEEYLKYKQYELYSIKLEKLFGHYDSFVKQELSADIATTLESIDNLTNIVKIIVTQDKTVITFSD